MTIGTRTQSPAGNLFTARAQQEEQNRRIPISQLPGSSVAPQPAPLVGGTMMPMPLMPGSAWPAPIMGYPQQNYMQPQPYPQGHNPFL